MKPSCSFIPRAGSIRACITGIATAVAAMVVVGCATKPPEETVPASMAVRYGTIQDMSKVKVKVSLGNRAVYVMEGDEPRFVAAVAIGTPSDPTPTGTFKVQHKEVKKRSSSYGFFVKDGQVIPGERRKMPSGYRYVGYPLPYWVYFSHGCGFHAGAVWPQPRTHGCLRLHKTIADDFYHMVKVGTPVIIQNSLPEDATIGKNVPRPTDYAHPDSPPSVRASDAVFTDMDNVWF
ncbi:MAG: L,D-transpeptidase [Verrucomicrobiales bacterium]|nr:L,D-transpeptidase [Verrucomicrobiales bacterium]